MLDKNTSSVLKVLKRLSDGNIYKVITGDEILANLNKSNYDLESIKQIIEFLEKNQFIAIKFSEENTYCYSLLPKARIYLEQEAEKPNLKTDKKNIMHYIYIMIASFIGTMLALLIFFYLTF